MISSLDYNELLRYKEHSQQIPGVRSPRLQRLINGPFLEPAEFGIDPNTGNLIVIAYQITVAGEDALAEYERTQDEMRKQDADHKADRRAQIVAAVLGACAGSAMTLLVEHFREILEIFH